MCKIVGFVVITTTTTIYHGVGPPVDLFLSQVSRSVCNGLSWFLLPFGLWLFSVLSNLLWAFVYLLQPISSLFLYFVQNWGYV